MAARFILRVVKAGGRGEGLGELVYIGREHRSGKYGHLAQSPLANPYHIGRDGDRAAVIKKYAVWLDRELENPESPAALEFVRIMGLLLEKRTVGLVCWCAPQACHGDVIRQRVWDSWGLKEGQMLLRQGRGNEPVYYRPEDIKKAKV